MVSPGTGSPARLLRVSWPIPMNWGLLVLFLLFSTLIGVREAQARSLPWMSIGTCAASCSAAFPMNWTATPLCAGCLITAGLWLRETLWGGGHPGGYACAKAGYGC
jgi:hypothetical protein